MKKWPHWLKGGLILVAIYSVIACVWLVMNRGTCSNFECAGFWGLVNLPSKLISSFSGIDILALPSTDYGSLMLEIASSIIGYFAIGAIVGQFMKAFKLRFGFFPE